MGWANYLERFHDEHPGITSDILRRSRSADGLHPYAWLLSAMPPGRMGRVLDLGCGDAPMRPALSDARSYIGVDRSALELSAAPGGGGLVQADAAAIPLPAGCMDIVVSSMALMIMTPLSQVLTEIRRVLVGGGLLVATLPASRPLRFVDLPVVGGLVAALGRELTYPNDGALRRLPGHLAEAGLRLVRDERRRFGYQLRSAADADRFLDSLYLPDLYLPDLGGWRYQRARAYLRSLARVHATVPIPIRRIVARASQPDSWRTRPAETPA